MSEKEKKELTDLILKVKELAQKDPKGMMLVKNSIDVLKTRADMEEQIKVEEMIGEGEGQ